VVLIVVVTGFNLLLVFSGPSTDAGIGGFLVVSALASPLSIIHYECRSVKVGHRHTVELARHRYIMNRPTPCC